MVYSTAKVEATTATWERGLQLEPVRHWVTNNDFQGALDSTVKLGSSALDVAGRAGMEDEGNLGEGKARAQKGACNLNIAETFTFISLELITSSH